jgi:hypothetical protein
MTTPLIRKMKRYRSKRLVTYVPPNSGGLTGILELESLLPL